MSEWLTISIYLSFMLFSGIGMAYYELYMFTGSSTSTLAYHILQLWWKLLAIFAIYGFRAIHYDTVFRYWGELAAIIGAGVVGYIVGRALFFGKESSTHVT